MCRTLSHPLSARHQLGNRQSAGLAEQRSTGSAFARNAPWFNLLTWASPTLLPSVCAHLSFSEILVLCVAFSIPAKKLLPAAAQLSCTQLTRVHQCRPEEYNVNLSEAEANFKNLQRALHPDKFAMRSSQVVD